jgi:CDP-diacylglycerol---glycerol-3-phosphate 3-phosphatidyltransferase
MKARIPTVLTWLRVAAVPVLSVAGLLPVFHGQRAVLTSCFVACAITDWADGYLARMWQADSAFGAFLDPVADKLMVAAALILVAVRFAHSSAAPVLAVSAIVIITREIVVSALREWMATAVVGGRDLVKVGFVGKVKTATQMTALSVLLAVQNVSSPIGVAGTVCLAASAFLALLSAAGYVKAALPTFGS